MYPKCEKSECFGNEKGACVVLYDNDFCGRECPFYKSREVMTPEAREEACREYERVRSSG